MKGDGNRMDEEQLETMAEHWRSEPHFLRLNESDALVNILAKLSPPIPTTKMLSCQLQILSES